MPESANEEIDSAAYKSTHFQIDLLTGSMTKQR